MQCHSYTVDGQYRTPIHDILWITQFLPRGAGFQSTPSKGPSKHVREEPHLESERGRVGSFFVQLKTSFLIDSLSRTFSLKVRSFFYQGRSLEVPEGSSSRRSGLLISSSAAVCSASTVQVSSEQIATQWTPKDSHDPPVTSLLSSPSPHHVLTSACLIWPLYSDSWPWPWGKVKLRKSLHILSTCRGRNL